MKIDPKKIDLWSERFKGFNGNCELADFPKRLTIEISNRCNLECKMCPRHKMNYELGHMDLGLFKKIIDEVIEHKRDTDLVLFFRGESLLNPQFKSMLEYATAKGLQGMSIATNAMLLDEQMSEAILKSGIGFISFSIDAASEKEYTEQRIGANYNQLMKNIDHFLALKDKMDQKKPETQVSLVETELTKDSIDKFIEIWKNRVDRVRIYKEHSKGDDFGQGVDNADEIHFENRLPCPKLINDMIIYFNGDIAICNHDWDREQKIGNLREKSISDIWKSPAYEQLRLRHINGDLEDEKPCRDCDFWKTFYLDTGMFGRLICRD